MRQVSLIGAAMATVGGFAITLYSPAMPSLVRAFGTDIPTINLSVTLYLLGYALSQLVVGSLSDAVGRRPVSTGFLALYLVATVLAVAAPNVAVLLVARMLQGVGTAVSQTIARAIVRDCYSGPTAARIMNTIGVALAIAPLIAPTLGGAIIELFGWHAAFLAMGLHGLVVLAMILTLLPETAPATGLDRLKPWSMLGDYLAVGSDARFARLTLLSGFVMGTIYAGQAMLPFVLIDRIGLSPVQFGLAMLIHSGSYTIGTQAFRVLHARFSPKRIIGIGIVLSLIGAAFLGTPLALGPPALLSVMVPIGMISFSVALIFPVATTAALEPFPEKAGAASALIGFAQIGCGLLGASAAALIGDPVRSLMIVYPSMVVAGVLSYWLIGRGRTVHDPAPAE